MTGQLALLLLYSAALVALGVWIGRRVGTSSAFFVAGRRLGPGLLFATLLAANIGAGSTVGAAGLGYGNGIAAWWWVGSAGIGTALLAVWLGPRVWKLAHDHDLKTVGDYLELRFGRPVRGIVSALLWVGTLAILAGQLIAMAWILDVVAGVPKIWGCLIGGAVMTVYFSAGGLLTSAWVNLVQLVVMLGGFAVALPWIWFERGGWSAIRAAAPAGHDSYFDPFTSGGSGIVYLALLVPSFLISPGILQKLYGARDERAVRIGVGWCAAALLVFAAVPPLLGMAARSLAPALPNPELALPTVFSEGLPPLLGTLALAAVLSAEISSADAILFMLSTSLSEDLYKRFLAPDASDRSVLRVARLAAVAGGGLGIVLAIALPSVIDALKVFYSLLGISLFVPIVFGIHSRRGGTAAAVAAIAGGIAALLIARGSPAPIPLLTPNLIALIVSALCYFGVAAATRRRAVNGER